MHNIKPIANGPLCKLPDGNIIQPTETGQLKGLNELSTKAKETNIHPTLQASLISIGQLCDDGCTAVFKKDTLEISKNNKIILRGERNRIDGLWDIPLKTDEKEIHINAIVKKNTAKHKLANYLHACAGSPVLTTFQKAISNGNFMSWPGIDEIRFKKYAPNQEATAKGHLDQERQGLQSTQEDAEPMQEEKTKQTMATVVPFTQKEFTYTDQTGKFPFRSTRGYEYIMVMYDYDANAILARPFKTRQAKELVETWTKLYKDLTNNGHTTKCFIMDNECSTEMKTALNKYKLQYQLVPPEVHRRNAAERAIRTFKNHFLSCLATCHNDFPIREWDRLLPQAILTLNMLRNSRVNTKLSAYTYLFGNYDFNRLPLAPFGSKVMIHNKTKNRG